MVEPEEPRLLPSAIARSDNEATTLFRSQIERAPNSYFAFKKSIEIVDGISPSYLAEMLESDLEGTQKYSVIHLWAIRDPQSALEHLRGWSRDDTFKANAMGQVLESWAMKDAEAAEAWLRNHLETENPKQDAFGIFGDLKEALVRGVAKSDPHLAFSLLREFKIHGAFSKIAFETKRSGSQSSTRVQRLTSCSTIGTSTIPPRLNRGSQHSNLNGARKHFASR